GALLAGRASSAWAPADRRSASVAAVSGSSASSVSAAGGTGAEGASAGVAGAGGGRGAGTGAAAIGQGALPEGEGAIGPVSPAGSPRRGGVAARPPTSPVASARGARRSKAPRSPCQ